MALVPTFGKVGGGASDGVEDEGASLTHASASFHSMYQLSLSLSGT